MAIFVVLSLLSISTGVQRIELEQRGRIGDFLRSGTQCRSVGSYRQTELRVWTVNEAWVRGTYIKEMVDNAVNIMEGSRLCMLENGDGLGSGKLLKAHD